MTDDNIFRIVLAISIVLLLPVALYHRIRSQSTGERLDRRQEGWLILVTLRPVGIVCMLGLLVYLANPEWMAWSALPLPIWLRWVGVGLGVAGGALLVWTFATIGKNITDTVVTRRDHTLVTHGPYRWVRHPFYVAAALSWLANGLATANWFIFATGAIALALIRLRTPIEEANLLARFGDAYRDYMQRTPRFVPRLTSRAQ